MLIDNSERFPAVAAASKPTNAPDYCDDRLLSEGKAQVHTGS